MDLEQLPADPDWSKYPVGLWGFAGMDRQCVRSDERRSATRARIGHRGLYKAGFCRLADGSLLASPCFDAGGGAYRMKIYHSGNNGDTWTRRETHGAALLGKEPALQVLQDGTLLLITSHPHGFRVHRSEDGGTTWSVTPIGNAWEDEDAHWEPGGYDTVRNVLEEEDGSLLMPLSTSVEPDTGTATQTWLFRSRDGGRSWRKTTRAEVWDYPETMFGEAMFLRHRDGRLLAACRTDGCPPIAGPMPAGARPPAGGEAGNFLVLTESADNGATWSTPRTVSGYAEVHAHLLALRDGRLLMSYASYHVPYGVWAVSSNDGGQSWQHDRRVCLALSLGPYTGWPTSVELPDGEIVTVYAITAYQEGEGANLTPPGCGDVAAESVRWTPPPA